MKITEENYGQVALLICSGEMTEDSLDAFRSAVEQIEHRFGNRTDLPAGQAGQANGVVAGDLVLNLENVPFVDSAGLEYLLDLQERFAEKLGRVKLANLNEHVAKILEVTRLDNTFERFDDVSEAIKTM